MARFNLYSVAALVCLNFSVNVFSQDIPESMSSENPAAIPEDHKAILESDKVASKIHSDSTLAYQQQLKKVQLLKNIAVERKQIAEANAATCKINPSVCSELGLAVYDEKQLSKDEVQSIREVQESVEKKAKETVERNALLSADKALISTISLLGIVDGKALLNIEGSQLLLGVNESFNNIVVKQIVGSSVVVASSRIGISKRLTANGMGAYPVKTIAPLPKDETEQKAEGIE